MQIIVLYYKITKYYGKIMDLWYDIVHNSPGEIWQRSVCE